MKIYGTCQHNTLPNVETERLFLRQRVKSDAKDIFAYGSLKEVAEPAGFIPSESIEESENFITFWHQKLDEQCIPKGYGITLKGTDKIIGSVDFNRRYGNQQHILEMGYVLHPDYWGQGIIVEAASALIDVTFHLIPDIHKISVAHYSFNEKSKRVIQKLGFIYEGIERDAYYLNGIYYDRLCYGLLRQEWRKEF